MRTTIELPDNLLMQAKSQAALSGLSLREFFIAAVEQRLAQKSGKVRRAPPAIGDERHGPKIGILTPEQIDEAMFG
jgi:hypothetical protein